MVLSVPSLFLIAAPPASPALCHVPIIHHLHLSYDMIYCTFLLFSLFIHYPLHLHLHHMDHVTWTSSSIHTGVPGTVYRDTRIQCCDDIII